MFDDFTQGLLVGVFLMWFLMMILDGYYLRPTFKERMKQ